jgi:hypothetical protein
MASLNTNSSIQDFCESYLDALNPEKFGDSKYFDEQDKFILRAARAILFHCLFAKKQNCAFVFHLSKQLKRQYKKEIITTTKEMIKYVGKELQKKQKEKLQELESSSSSDSFSQKDMCYVSLPDFSIHFAG